MLLLVQHRLFLGNSVFPRRKIPLAAPVVDLSKADGSVPVQPVQPKAKVFITPAKAKAAVPEPAKAPVPVPAEAPASASAPAAAVAGVWS